MTVDPVNALALVALLVFLSLLFTRKPQAPERETYYIHDSPTGKAVVALTLSEASLKRTQGADLRGPYPTLSEAEQYLYHPGTYLPQEKK